jgi:hypothetical protein
MNEHQAPKGQQELPLDLPKGDDAKYKSLAELSAYCALCIKTLRTFLYHPDHPLPHYRLPREILVKIEDFDAWMARFLGTEPPRRHPGPCRGDPEKALI